MKAGGRPARFSARAGAAYWSALPSPRYHFQASMLPARSHSPRSVISWLDGVLVPVVDHRVDRHLEADRRAAAVPGEQRKGDRQAAPGAAAVDGQAVRVEAEVGGVARHPHQAGVAVFDRRRIRVLRGQAVLHGHDHRVDVLADHGRDRVLAVDVPQDHPAAVDEVDPGQRPGGIHRPVDPYRDVRCALGSGHRPVLGGHVRVRRDLHGRQQSAHGGPSLHDVRDGVETAGNRLLQLVQGFAAIRVDEIATGHEPSYARGPMQNASYVVIELTSMPVTSPDADRSRHSGAGPDAPRAGRPGHLPRNDTG